MRQGTANPITSARKPLRYIHHPLLYASISVVCLFTITTYSPLLFLRSSAPDVAENTIDGAIGVRTFALVNVALLLCFALITLLLFRRRNQKRSLSGPMSAALWISLHPLFSTTVLSQSGSTQILVAIAALAMISSHTRANCADGIAAKSAHAVFSALAYAFAIVISPRSLRPVTLCLPLFLVTDDLTNRASPLRKKTIAYSATLLVAIAYLASLAFRSWYVSGNACVFRSPTNIGSVSVPSISLVGFFGVLLVATAGVAVLTQRLQSEMVRDFACGWFWFLTPTVLSLLLAHTRGAFNGEAICLSSVGLALMLSACVEFVVTHVRGLRRFWWVAIGIATGTWWGISSFCSAQQVARFISAKTETATPVY